MRELVSGVSAAVMAVFVVGSVVAAPKKPAAKPTANNNGALIAAGKKVFGTSGCGGCHKVAGKGGNLGPDLSRVGKEHDAAWLEKKIKDPKSTKPDTTMPPFAGSAKDLKAVAAYLASLK